MQLFNKQQMFLRAGVETKYIMAGLHLGNNLNHRKLANWQELWSNYNI